MGEIAKTPGEGKAEAYISAPGSGRATQWQISTQQVDYEAAVAAMEARVAAIRAGTAPELVWLLEHPPLYTAGTGSTPDELLQPGRFPVYRTGRGGKFTYHGPGQRVGYVMLDLARFRRDVRCHVHRLEEWLIRSLADLGVTGERRADRIGVWTIDNAGREAKIAAIGVRVRRWVSYHGVALNVCPDLDHFGGIVPCGLGGFAVTSLAALGHDVEMAAVDSVLMRRFADVFGG